MKSISDLVSAITFIGAVSIAPTTFAADEYKVTKGTKLFLNAVAFAKYEEDKAGTLAAAKRKWPAMHHVAVSSVNRGKAWPRKPGATRRPAPHSRRYLASRIGE